MTGFVLQGHIYSGFPVLLQMTNDLHQALCDAHRRRAL